MELFWSYIRKYPFLYGILLGVFFCHQFYKEFRLESIHEKYNAQLELLASQLSSSENNIAVLKDHIEKQSQNERNYSNQVIYVETLERKLNQTSLDYENTSQHYTNLILMNWEEKYNQEKIGRITNEQELISLQKRVASSQSEKPTVDGHLIEQLSALQDQLRILKSEKERLQEAFSKNEYNSTNLIDKSELVKDWDKKHLLLIEKRNENISRLNILREQLLNLVKGHVDYNLMRIKIGKPMNVETFSKLQSEMIKNIMCSVITIQKLYIHWISLIYIDDEKTFREGLTLSFQDFNTKVLTRKTCLPDAESLVRNVIIIEKEDANVEKLFSLLDSHLSSCTKEK